MMDVYITGNGGTSQIYHIINGTGSSVGPSFATAYANQLWLNPTFSLLAGLDPSGTNIAIALPTESWHSYQLQYRNSLTDPSWSNLGSPFMGNDVLKTTTDSALGTNRFYRVQAR
jgi:hypothetical protein